MRVALGIARILAVMKVEAVLADVLGVLWRVEVMEWIRFCGCCLGVSAMVRYAV